MTSPDFAYWARTEVITSAELISLLCDVDPRNDDGVNDSGFDHALDTVRRAMLSGSLSPYNAKQEDIIDKTDLSHIYFKTSNVINWADETHPWLSAQLALRQVDTDDLMAVVDESSPHHSKELAIALEAWRAVFIGGKLVKGKSKKQSVRHYLDNNHDDLSEDAKERISVLINPDTAKRGGATRTGTS